MRHLFVQSSRPHAPGDDTAWPEGEAGWTQLVTRDGPVARGTVDHLTLDRAIAPLGQAAAHALVRACRVALRGGGELLLSLPDLTSRLARYARGEARDAVAEAGGAPWIATAAERLNRDLASIGWLYDDEEAALLAHRAGLDVLQQHRRADGWIDLHLQRPRCHLDEQPLVSVLMTAYKPTYFREALTSVLTQTWQQLEVLIFDDSPDTQIGEIVSTFTDPRVRYHKNPQRVRSQQNYVQAFAAAQGDLVKYVCDDDRLLPNCVERMVRCFQAHPDITLVTSARELIDERGQVMAPIAATRRPCTVDSRFDGALMVHLLLENRINFVGEPTTVMFRRADLAWARPHLISFKGMPAIGNGDVTKWLNLLSRGDAIYLAEPLSQFRLHATQAQRTEPNSLERGLRAWELNRQQAIDIGLYAPATVPTSVPEALGRRPWWPPALSAQVDPSALVDMAQAEQWAQAFATGPITAQTPKVLLELMRRFPHSPCIRYLLAGVLAALGLQEPSGKVWSLAKELCPAFGPISGVALDKEPIGLGTTATFGIAAYVPAMSVVLQLSTVNLRTDVQIEVRAEDAAPRSFPLAAGEPSIQLTLPVEFSPRARRFVVHWSRPDGIADGESIHLIGLGAVLRRPQRG